MGGWKGGGGLVPTRNRTSNHRTGDAAQLPHRYHNIMRYICETGFIIIIIIIIIIVEVIQEKKKKTRTENPHSEQLEHPSVLLRLTDYGSSQFHPHIYFDM